MDIELVLEIIENLYDGVLLTDKEGKISERRVVIYSTY